jgi:hypothetical protein
LFCLVLKSGNTSISRWWQKVISSLAYVLQPRWRKRWETPVDGGFGKFP